MHGVPSFRSFKMLDLAVHMPAGVNGVSQNSLQTDVILRLDSSSIRFAFKVPLAHHDIKPRVPGAVGRQFVPDGRSTRPDILLYYVPCAF